MSLTPIALLKLQLNLDHVLDDVLLQHKLDVAEAWIASYIGTPLADPVPAPVKEAALQLAAYHYGQREAVSFGVSMNAVPFGIYEMLSPYKDAVTGHVDDGA